MLVTQIFDEAAMLALGGQLALITSPGCMVFLYGELGAGKTTLTRGFLRAMGYTGVVKSPTYTLVEPYEVRDIKAKDVKRRIYHFDLYRLINPEELEYMGVRDYFDGESICIIEWPELGRGLLPLPDVSCYIEIKGESRQVRLVAHNKQGDDILYQLQQSGIGNKIT